MADRMQSVRKGSDLDRMLNFIRRWCIREGGISVEGARETDQMFLGESQHSWKSLLANLL